MKVYLIDTPDKLKAAAANMKYERDRQKALNVVSVWNAQVRRTPDKPIGIRVTLELGRSAVLMRETRQGKTQLGVMNLKPAREFAKGLSET